MTAERPAGPILDELGVRLQLAEHDRVTEVLLLAKITNLETGDVALAVASNDLDWIAAAGLHAAYQQTVGGAERREDDE